MAIDSRLIHELKTLLGRLQIRLRQGLKIRLLGPLQTGCAECALVVLEIGEGLRDEAGSPPGREPVLSIRIPLSASPTSSGRGADRRREAQFALAEAFSELSMSSGLGLSAADWSGVSERSLAES